MLRLIAAVWLALIALPAAAQTFPQLTGRVVDQADLLRPEQELDLSSKSEALEAQTGRQFVVATVKSLEGQDVADYATALGRHWKIGDEKRDDGVLLLVAPNERKVWIATGYGAEAFLPDILAGRITRDTILPRFRAGDMPGGITAGAEQIISTMSLPAEEAQRQAQQAQQQEANRDKGPNFLPMIFWGMIILFVFLSMARRAGGRRYRAHRGGRRRRGMDSGDLAIVLWGLGELAEAAARNKGRGWGGGGFGGFGGGGGGFGGFSGGGGSFGGGGAGGSW